MVIRLRSLRLRAVLVVITVVVMPMVALWLSLLYTGRAAKRVQQAVNDSAAAISERLLQSQAE